MKHKKLHISLFSLFIFTFPVISLSAESGSHNNHEGKEHLHHSEDPVLENLDPRYYHSHNGHSHDLSMAYVAFESDPIESSDEITGRWDLEKFETTDQQMRQMLQGSGYEIWLDVRKDYLQVTVRLLKSEKDYTDPPLYFTVNEGILSMNNKDFSIGYKNGRIVLGLLGMDEAYRYTFIR